MIQAVRKGVFSLFLEMGKRRDALGANEEPVVTLSAGDTGDSPRWRPIPTVPGWIIPCDREYSGGSASQCGLEKGIPMDLGWFPNWENRGQAPIKCLFLSFRVLFSHQNPPGFGLGAGICGSVL